MRDLLRIGRAHARVFCGDEILLSGNKQTDSPVAFVGKEYLPIGSFGETQVGPVCRCLALRRVLFLDDLKECLCRAIVVQQDPANGVLSAFGQIVGTDIEDFAARVIAENEQVRQLRNFGAPIHKSANCSLASARKQGVRLTIFDDRIRDFRIRPRTGRFKSGWPSGELLVAAFPDVPPQIRACGNRANLFHRVLTDIGHEHISVLRIPE